MLAQRDGSALLGLTRGTTMWELWHIQKGTIQHNAAETSRRFWSRELRPHVIEGLCKHYGCQIGQLETRTAHGAVDVTAARILLHPGSLPTGEATHLVINMISSGGFRHSYGQSENPFLPTIRAPRSDMGFLCWRRQSSTRREATSEVNPLDRRTHSGGRAS
jgi:hypothetical protein